MVRVLPVLDEDSLIYVDQYKVLETDHSVYEVDVRSLVLLHDFSFCVAEKQPFLDELIINQNKQVWLAVLRNSKEDCLAFHIQRNTLQVHHF